MTHALALPEEHTLGEAVHDAPPETPNRGRRESARVLPYSDDAESAVLGAMLQEPGVIAEVRGILSGGQAEFFSPRNRILFATIVGLLDAGRAIDGVLIREELERQGQFDRVGGYEYLGELVGSVPSWMRAREYATTVHEHYIRRRMIDAAESMMTAAYACDPVNSLVASASETAQAAATMALSANAESGSIVDVVAQAFEELLAPKEQTTTISTGYPALDNIVYGFEPGELVLIGARPSRGKTALALGLAENLAVEGRVPTLVLSLEMNAAQISRRLILSRARVNSHEVRHGRLTEDDQAAMHQAARDLQAAPLAIFARTKRIGDICNLCRVSVRERGTRVVMVDYLSLIETTGRRDRYDLELASITKALKDIAGELGVTVILLAQLNRKLDSEDRPPRMADFRDSGAIEQDADKIIAPWQKPELRATDGAQNLATGDIDLIVLKHRNGPTGSATLRWVAQCARFENQSTAGFF